MTLLRVKIGKKYNEDFANMTNVETLDNQTFQVGELTIPYCDHIVPPAIVATLRARGVFVDGDNTWINSEIDT